MSGSFLLFLLYHFCIIGLPSSVFSQKSSAVIYCKDCCGKKGFSDSYVKYNFTKELQILEFVHDVGFISVHFVHQPNNISFKALYHLFTYHPKVKCAQDIIIFVVISTFIFVGFE